ncbi:MAG: hypothetical protein IKL16_05010 [Clostridia bacterium]|nr:hypothetical protein [Clostridia bacterium]
MHHLACLISTIKCSAHVLKLIECIKWMVIITTFAVTSICACKMLKNSYEK